MRNYIGGLFGEREIVHDISSMDGVEWKYSIIRERRRANLVVKRI
jgi:hypothetical protein